MAEDLFALLKGKGITDGHSAFEVVDGLGYEETLDFALDCFVSIKLAPTIAEPSLFRFAPIPSIAGGTSPCMDTECRIEAAYSLSLLGALYADQLVLPNFFDYMYYMTHGDKEPPETEEELAEFKYTFASDIAVYFMYKPLLDSGIAVINCTIPAVCKDCHIRHQQEAEEFRLELEKVLKVVEPKLRKKVRFVYDENEYITIENDDHYLGGNLGWSVRNKLLEAMKKHRELPHILSEAEIKKFGLREAVIDHSVNDILEYDFYPSLNTATYLTNRPFDIDLIEGTKKRAGSAKLANRFPAYHKVPYLEDVRLEDVVALRLKEDKSFQVYRDAVTKLVQIDDEQEARDYFNSTVGPAINKIDNVISDNKNRYRARAGRKVKIRSVAALAGIGVSHLLGVPLTATAGVLGTGGLLVAADVIDDMQTSREFPPEAKQNSFYFLWGIKQKHSQ